MKREKILGPFTLVFIPCFHFLFSLLFYKTDILLSTLFLVQIFENKVVTL